MKKRLRFFCFSFFSHEISKDGRRRGYTSAFLAFVLALIFLWAGFTGGDMLPFGTHYKSSPDFAATVHAVLANPDYGKRIFIETKDGKLKAKKQDGEYADALLINTFESEADRQHYSVNGYNAVVDLRPADTIAEVEAYCVSNDGRGTEISYDEYLTLSEVARLNFDFKLRYTGRALELTDDAVAKYSAYLGGSGDENKAKSEKLASELAEGKITRSEYNRAVYELYFVSYYPSIAEYEGTSKIPLLRNYYYHQYLSRGATKYLLVFDDYIAGSFETKSGVDVSFYGFYTDMADGVPIVSESSQKDAIASADRFIKDAFAATSPLSFYIHMVNVASLVPYIALMLIAITLLTSSVLKLRGVQSVTSFGSVFKIVGSYAWFSGAISSIFTIIAAFFVDRNILNAIPTILFFAMLAVRSVIFAVKESRSYAEQLEQKEAEQTEV